MPRPGNDYDVLHLDFFESKFCPVNPPSHAMLSIIGFYVFGTILLFFYFVVYVKVFLPALKTDERRRSSSESCRNEQQQCDSHCGNEPAEDADVMEETSYSFTEHPVPSEA